MAKDTHKSLMDDIVKAEKALDEAKLKYKEFCKDNPLEIPKQPTAHELILQRRKLEKTTAKDHEKANIAAANRIAKNQLNRKIEGK